MKKRIFQLYAIAIIFLFPLLSVQAVFAHGDDARIEISPERLNPGGALDIRGVGFEPEAEVTLLLVGPQVNTPLGKAIADVEGVFQLTTMLPIDLVEGMYVIQGTTEDGHTLISPELTIWGMAIPVGGEGGPIDEGDTLLAPFPTVAPGVSTPMNVSTSVPASESSPPTESATFPYPWIAVGIGIVLISLFVLKSRK